MPSTDPSAFETTLLNFGTGAFFMAAVIELAFLIHYIVVAPAFKSWIGWMFVLRSASFFFAGIAILLGRVLGPTYPGRPYITLGLYALVLFSACVTYGTFLRERRKGQVTRRGSGGTFLRFARRAIGLDSTRKRQAAPGSEGEPNLRIVEDSTL